MSSKRGDLRRALQLTSAVLQCLVDTLAIHESREVRINMPTGHEYLSIGQVLDIADQALEPTEKR
jgi:hypothetical protein